MIREGIQFDTVGDALRISTRGYLRCSIRITADDASSGAVHIRRGYYELGVVAYDDPQVATLNGSEVIDLVVDDCPELVVYVATAGSGEFDVEWTLDTPARDNWETILVDLGVLGRAWETTQLPEEMDRATTIGVLSDFTNKAGLQLRAAVDGDGHPTSLQSIALLTATPNTTDIPPRSLLEIYTNAKSAGFEAAVGLYRIESPARYGIDSGGTSLPTNVAYLNVAQDWTAIQRIAGLQVEGVVGGLGTGYHAIESDATSLETVTLGNFSGDIPILTDVSPALGEFLVRQGTGEYQSRDLLWSDIGPSYAGTSFPGSPSDGQPFFRTDLDIPELFHYDATRSKWLGELRIWAFGRNTAASSGDLSLRWASSVEGNSSRGLLTPSALTIVGAELFSAASFSADLDIFEGSTNLGTLLTISAARDEHDHTLDFDLDADSGWPHKYPKITGISSGSCNNPMVQILLRRRET